LLIAYGNFVFRHRNTIFPVALGALILAFPPQRASPDGAWDFYRDLGVVLVALLGEGIRVLTVGLEYIKRGGLNRRVYADYLVTHGVFAHCRNPLYVGNIMLALALLGIPDRLPVVLIGGALVVVTYVAIVAAEEVYLRRTFGAEFEEYCRQVNRWLPDPRGLAATVRSMRFNWKRVLLKEATSFYGWTAMACLLDAIEIRFTGISSHPEFLIFLSMFAISTIGFITIRILKKAGILRLDS
jgi:protein-S-isoprenylcysteine O-methyltransferase Ste14